MKNIIMEIPRSGASVQLVLRAGASSGQAAIVASDDVEIHLAEPAPAAAAQLQKPAATNKVDIATPKSPNHDLDAIFKRLIKLKPNKRAAAVNSIKAMFQLTAPINDEEANRILEALRRRGNLTIDASDKLQIRNA
jgi:hypothetical protein